MSKFKQLKLAAQYLTDAARKAGHNVIIRVASAQGTETGGETPARFLPAGTLGAGVLFGTDKDGNETIEPIDTIELSSETVLMRDGNHTPEQVEGIILAGGVLFTAHRTEGIDPKDLGFESRKSWWCLPRGTRKFNKGSDLVKATGSRFKGIGIRFQPVTAGPMTAATVAAREAWGVCSDSETGKEYAEKRVKASKGKDKARKEREVKAKELKDGGMVMMTVAVPEWFAKAVHTATAKANKDAAKPEDNGDTLVRMTGAKAPVESTEDDNILERADLLQATG